MDRRSSDVVKKLKNSKLWLLMVIINCCMIQATLLKADLNKPLDVQSSALKALIIHVGATHGMPEKYSVWALTSSGGFHGSGRGHIFIYINPNQSGKSLAIKTPPMIKLNDLGGDAIKKLPLKKLETKVISSFITNIKKMTTESYSSEGMDIYKYKLYHIEIGSKIEKEKLILSMDDPFRGKGSKNHQKIIEIFTNLATKH